MIFFCMRLQMRLGGSRYFLKNVIQTRYAALLVKKYMFLFFMFSFWLSFDVFQVVSVFDVDRGVLLDTDSTHRRWTVSYFLAFDSDKLDGDSVSFHSLCWHP